MHPNNFTLKAFALKFDGYFINILWRNESKMTAADADIYIWLLFKGMYKSL